ncbi:MULTISPECIES: ABC transporter substrate-binding protein [unclassified Roseitalea]|uniref:ABC transporter substrate-binding protein n=1 Tax=unclassified Roseitalea TaxID=2639107 RepID=UPI00273DBC74|nr:MULTISPECIES: ABC transporter substrate-binding protein [unclassified Roseitalea]
MMRITKRAMLALGVAAALAGGGVPAMAEGVLKVGAYPANPPWQFKNESGAFEGFEVDIVNEIAERMGMTTDIQAFDFKALFVASASRRVDMVISSLTITNERLESQSFTQPYFQGALGVGVRADSDISGVADFEGKRIGSIATSFPENWVKEREDELAYRAYNSYDTVANMLTDLRSGRVDAVVNDIVGLRYAFTQMEGLEVAEEIVTGEQFAMMMPKGSDKLEQVNQIISDMKTDGTMNALHEKWFGVPAAPDSLTLTPMDVPTSVDG